MAGGPTIRVEEEDGLIYVLARAPDGREFGILSFDKSLLDGDGRFVAQHMRDARQAQHVRDARQAVTHGGD